MNFDSKTVRDAVQKSLHQGFQKWSGFWFEETSHRRIELFRTAFAFLMFFFYLIKSMDLELFYSESGILPRAVLEDVYGFAYRFSLFFVFDSTWVLWFFDILYLLCYVALFFGVACRWAALLALVIHISFVYRNVAVVYGVDLIATFYLLYLVFADHSSKILTERFQKKLPGFLQGVQSSKPKGLASDLASTVFRFGQIEVCVIYLYSGVHKLKGAGWWSGDGIWQVIGNSQLARMDFSWASHFPGLLIFATYLTLVWEVYFPVLVWPKSTRRIMLALGFLIHLGIAISVNLIVFGLLMTTLYLLFMEENEAEKLLHQIARWKKKRLLFLQ